MHVLGFVTLLSLVHVCLGQVQVCYRNGGIQTSNDVPCDPDVSSSTCCGPGFICETNLYCLSQDGLEVIGSCTESTWNSVNCPFALNGTGELFSFNNVTNCSDGTVCPKSNNTSCCEANQGVEVISYYNTAIIPTPTDDLSAYYANAGYSIPVTTSAHSSSASNSLSMTTTGATSASAVPTSTRPAITTAASPTSSTVRTTTSTSQASSSSSGGLSRGASAGIGVGTALGVLVAGAAVILFICKRKRKNGVVEKHLPGRMMETG